MRKLLKLVSATGVAIVLAPSAQANNFVGTASFALSTLPGLVASGGGSGRSRLEPNVFTIRRSQWAATGPTLITLAPTAAAPLSALNIVLTAPGPCSFTGAGGPGGGLGGACALGGTANALVGGAPFLIVPLHALGVAGRISFGPYGSYIDAQSWTTGVAPVTLNGVVLTTDGIPITMRGSDNRFSDTGWYRGSGNVTLVAPAALMSTLGGRFPLFVSMSFAVGLAIPEPGTLLLLGSGVAGLAMLGRRRMRSRS